MHLKIKVVDVLRKEQGKKRKTTTTHIFLFVVSVCEYKQ